MCLWTQSTWLWELVFHAARVLPTTRIWMSGCHRIWFYLLVASMSLVQLHFSLVGSPSWLLWVMTFAWPFFFFFHWLISVIKFSAATPWFNILPMQLIWSKTQLCLLFWFFSFCQPCGQSLWYILHYWHNGLWSMMIHDGGFINHLLHLWWFSSCGQKNI